MGLKSKALKNQRKAGFAESLILRQSSLGRQGLRAGGPRARERALARP